MTTLPRPAKAVLVALAVACAAVLVDAGPAAAATGTVNTSGTALNVRKAPNTATAVVGTLADGASITISCQTYGQQVTGTYGTTTLWDYVPAKGGFVSDAYVYTGSSGRVAPDCTDTDVTSQCSAGNGCAGQATFNRADHTLTVYDNDADGSSGLALYWLSDGTGPYRAWNSQGAGTAQVFTISLPAYGWVFYKACTGERGTNTVHADCSAGTTGYA